MLVREKRSDGNISLPSENENYTEKLEAMFNEADTTGSSSNLEISSIANTVMDNLTHVLVSTLSPSTSMLGTSEFDNFTASTLITSTDNVNEMMKTTPDESSADEIKDALNVLFLIINSLLVFFLQGGFAFLEAGSVRSKNTTNILIKNLLDSLLACAAFWSFGYMFAYSDGNSFIGTDIRYICSINLDPGLYAHWFWCFVFCATAATIVSGAVAERCDLTAYFVYSVVLSGLVYPVVAHWAWTPNGWLAVNGYIDFAGSGVVHHLGGVCGFVGAVMLGPRIGRFDDKGKPQDIPGHSVPLAALGAFILLFGFFAFNGSTQGAIASRSDMLVVQRAVLNTMIGGCSSGLTTLIIFRFSLYSSGKKWSLLSTINGTLCGMISTCAFCNLAEPYATFIVGILASGVYTIIHYGMLWLKIDDPLDAFAVHSGGGMLGVLVAPLVVSSSGPMGHIFDSENNVTLMHQIWSQLVGILVITAWSAILSTIMFYILKLNNKLRVSPELEIQGLDIAKHGESAYPVESWREIQYGDSEDRHNIPSFMSKNSPTLKKMTEKDSYEMKNYKDAEPVKDINTVNSKMIGTWSNISKELRNKLEQLENYKESEVVLTVKPAGFQPSSNTDESETTSTISSEIVQKCTTGIVGGFTNQAFDDNEDMVDYVKPSLIEDNKQLQETHFDGSWRNIDEEIEKKLKQDAEKNLESLETNKEFHSSTLRLDAVSKDENLTAKMDFGDDSYKEDGIYEQLTEKLEATAEVKNPVQRIKNEEFVGNTTLEFNNSRESSVI